mmetsp:Transcript_10056/g.22539  ORF Transcript_10056/g.22539 Transcript_10056/m.22539 type:complete len:271 (+) Transcript_10056:363-1175(+)
MAQVHAAREGRLIELSFLLLPALPHLSVRLRRSPDLKGEGVRRLQAVIGPVNGSARAWIADLLAGGPEGALAMIGIKSFQNAHHRRLVATRQSVLRPSPRHVHSKRPAVHTQEGGRLILIQKHLDNSGLRLAERLVAFRCSSAFGIPLLVPVAVQVNPVGVLPHAEVALLDLLPGPRVGIEDDLELALAQDISWLPVSCHFNVAAEPSEHEERAFGANQLPRVLPGNDEDLVLRVSTWVPHGNHLHLNPLVSVSVNRHHVVAGSREPLNL